MINLLSLFLLSMFIFSCSLHDTSGFWSKETEIKKDQSKFEVLFKKEETQISEFNKNLKINLDKSKITIDNFSNLNNNDGYTLFDGNLKKLKKYNFSRIKDYKLFEPNLIFDNTNIIFFNNDGSILKFNDNSKLIWKINNYTKDEKKSGPLLSMSSYKDKLIVVDNLYKIYIININDGKILWSKKNNTSSNSQIKVIEDKILFVDSNNNLNCFSITDGKKIWSHSTEQSFINSSKRLSLIVKNEIVVFNNTLGDVTAVNLKDGSLIWQISTQNTQNFSDIINLKTSSIVENENSIFFSNNKNQFYSIDLETGVINWMQNINSDIKPAIVNKLIFTISLDGYLFTIDKTNGNILRSINLFSGLKSKKDDSFIPSGFRMNFKELFIATNNGRLVITNIQNGKINEIIKVDSQKISRPFIKNQNMYLIKDNSIINLN